METFTNHIPILPLCKIIEEYCHYPRPYLKEFKNATKIMFPYLYSVIDLGYTPWMICRYKSIFIISSELNSERKYKIITSLFKRENNRRIDMGLKPNINTREYHDHENARGWIGY